MDTSCQYDGVNLVGFYARVSYRTDHPRIGDDHTFDEWAKDPFDRRAVACRLNDDFILDGKRLPELDQTIVDQFDPLFSCDLSVLQERRLCERAMDIHADDRQ